MSLIERLELGEARVSESLWLEAPGRGTWTYRDFDRFSTAYASTLSALGVTPGDRVVVQVEKSVEAVFLYWACLKLGAVYVPLNTAYTVPEVGYFLGDAEPKLFVCSPENRSELSLPAKNCRVQSVETLGAAGEGSWLERVGAIAGRPFEAPKRQPGDLAAILYTSGTTGRSKGAMLSRKNLASNAEALVEEWRITSSDKLIHALPIYHTHGLFVGLNATIGAGASMIFLPRFDADEVIGLFPRATLLMGVPTFYTRLLKAPGLTRASAASMRLFVSGSAPLLAETHREFLARTGYAILERYGMTETGMNSSNPCEGERIPGSVGRPLPGVEIRVTDPASGMPLEGPERIGMLEVRGPNVFGGYWRNPEKTREELRPDGFFVTGDLGKIDDKGYVWIVGRGKDLVITGGFNVYPKEVETELDSLEGVVESAVIGVPHPDLGEGVTAVVVKAPGRSLTEDEILKILSGRLAKFKRPKRVIFVDELPRNTMGKVQKSILRDRYATLYGSAPGS